MHALSFPDFRLLWLGSFGSFLGSWIQRPGYDWLTYALTNDNSRLLALVSFAGMAPVTILGPIAGAMVDIWDRRKLLTWLLILSAVGPLFLAFSTFYGFTRYEHLMFFALWAGVIGAFEMPARQSIVRQAVPTEHLAAAIPAQALTFNFSRIVGPSIGGVVFAVFGAPVVFAINGLSFFFLIRSVRLIRVDLGPLSREATGIIELIRDGFLYTFRHKNLKRLFLMEGATSVFGIFYLTLMAAIAKTMLGLDQAGLGRMFSAIGVGAVAGLFTLGALSNKPFKMKIVKIAMTAVAISVACLGFVRSEWLAYPLLAVAGAGAIMQFNTTNTLFQLYSPEAMRGRVIAMHAWAVSGLAPLGILLFGWLSEEIGIRETLWAGGGTLFVLALVAWFVGRDMRDPELLGSD